MTTSRTLGIPELAGLATYEEAAHVGYSVDENVRRLLRLHWVERRLMQIAVARLPATPEWEVKCALAFHQWQDVEHADALRRRIGEMRSPLPKLDAAPDAALDGFLEEVLRARDTVELLGGAYVVARAALCDAYREHFTHTNPLVDQPTRRVLRANLAENEEALDWGARARAALLAGDVEARARAAAWDAHLRAYLEAAGGVAGGGGQSCGDAAAPILPPPRAAQPFVPDMHPRRDARFEGQYNFSFPPHVVYSAPGVSPEERNLALLCKRTLELDVPEMMASIIVERQDRPWEFYRDYSRQLWDEARHAMMGTVALEARGVDWTRIPLNVSFALRLNLHASPLERQIMLYGIEQSLMAGETGKRFEYETAAAAGDALSAHFHDYDWADEVLHAQIGRRWVVKAEGIPAAEAIERARAIHTRTWAALDAYRHRDEQLDWWPGFVRQVLGKDTGVRGVATDEVKVIPE